MTASLPTLRRISPAVCLALAGVVLFLAAGPASAFDLRSLFSRKKFDAVAMAVDGNEAVRILSAYRRQHGLGAVRLDPTLTRIAASHALKMASTDKVAHVLRGDGSFARRLATGGYDASVAAENIGGGYDNLDEAFAAWRKSKGHDKNLLKPDVTVIGIAAATAPGSKYGTYWALVLAHPYEPPQGRAPGPSAGPGLVIGR